MKRDKDLIKVILAYIEKYDKMPNEGDIVYDPGEIKYHIELLVEAGFIKATIKEMTDETVYSDEALTWAGHELLDKMRSYSD